MSYTSFEKMLLDSDLFLRKYALGFTRDNISAEDLLQDTFCKALVSRKTFTEGSNFKAWILTIMRNTFINAYHRNVKHKVFLYDNMYKYAESHRHNLHVEYPESRISEHYIMHAVHNLPEVLKVSFVMFIHGYKYCEIADILQEPLGTIKSRIFLARKRLKGQICS